jgi:Na+/H+ antiporter NhaD/arsenite permease-like protein
MAREMLHFIGMRPISALFLMAAIGFVFILHKKDVPEVTDSKMRKSELRKVSKHNWMKRALYTSRVAAKTASKQRKENEVP